MKNTKIKNYQNHYLLNKNKNSNINKSPNKYNIISPTKEKYFLTDQNIKEEDYYLSKTSQKYLDNNTNYTNNSYNYMTPLSDFNKKYSSPELNNEYTSKNNYIGQKYNDMPYNNYEYQKYIEDEYNMKYENENGNEKLCSRISQCHRMEVLHPMQP